MAETERQKLERYISIIESWRATRPADEIWSVFSNLEELDQKKNEALWNELESVSKKIEKKKKSWGLSRHIWLLIILGLAKLVQHMDGCTSGN